MKILIVDNFDSFTNNIAQYVFEASGHVPDVIPNTTAFEDIGLENYDAIIISPGPGRPERDEDFGVCRKLVERFTKPLLGICLGHQGINHYLGGTVDFATRPVHGYTSTLAHSGRGLFEGIPQHLKVVRYHSLTCTKVAECLNATAHTDDGVVMALEHRTLPVFGVQFHPESIDSEFGHLLLSNFIKIAASQKLKSQSDRALSDALALVGCPRVVAPVHELWGNALAPDAVFDAMFSHSDCAFWLDSEKADKRLARFSVMGRCDAHSAVKFSYNVDTRRMALSGPAGKTELEGDFFSLMSSVQRMVRPDISAPAMHPFSGGLVGYLGYELKGLSGVKNGHSSYLPDAILYLPQNLIVFDHHTGEVWATNLWGNKLELPPRLRYSCGDPPAWFIPGAVPAEYLRLKDEPSVYMDKITKCLGSIDQGESYEICLTNRAYVPLDGSEMAAYKRMRAISPVPYGAFLKNAECSVLSASPECFIKVEKCGRVVSKPIKGTRPRGTSPEEDASLKASLAASAKDHAENLMIVDLVRHDLNAICIPGTVSVPEAFAVQTFSSVHQLVSTVEGKLKAGLGPFDVIKSCFPGGSMTGAPKIRSMEIIDSLESCARGIYSGAIGWIGLDGYTDLSIVIRTIVVRDNIAEFGIGGAIVAASNPIEELQETLVKASVPYSAIVDGGR